jgi:hypothetical protein
VRAPPKVTNGGHELKHLDVINVYVGSFWNKPEGQTMLRANDGFTRSLDNPNDGFNQLLAQYGAPQQHFVKSVVVPIDQGVLVQPLAEQIASQLNAGVTPKHVALDFSSSNLASQWTRDIRQLLLTVQAPKDNTLYNLVLEPGMVADPGDPIDASGGYHAVLSDGRLMSVIMGVQTLARLTRTESHEDAEARTNPYLGPGVTVGSHNLFGVTYGGEEIADATGQSGLSDGQGAQCSASGYSFQVIWSVKDKAYEIAPKTDLQLTHRITAMVTVRPPPKPAG